MGGLVSSFSLYSIVSKGQGSKQESSKRSPIQAAYYCVVVRKAPLEGPVHLALVSTVARTTLPIGSLVVPFGGYHIGF